MNSRICRAWSTVKFFFCLRASWNRHVAMIRITTYFTTYSKSQIFDPTMEISEHFLPRNVTAITPPPPPSPHLPTIDVSQIHKIDICNDDSTSILHVSSSELLNQTFIRETFHGSVEFSVQKMTSVWRVVCFEFLANVSIISSAEKVN